MKRNNLEYLASLQFQTFYPVWMIIENVPELICTIIKMQPSITCDGKMVVFLLFQLTNVLFPISNVLSLT